MAAGVCSNTPGAGDHIQCEESETSTDDIDIDAAGIDIDLTGTTVTSSGVYAEHLGSGNVDINIAGATAGMATTSSMIDTTGEHTHGVRSVHVGEGTLTFSLEDTEIRTQGSVSHGLHGQHRGTGHLKADLGNGVIIDTKEENSVGVVMEHGNTDTNRTNNITLLAEGVSITTAGTRSQGISALREGGLGNINMTVRDSTVTTGGHRGYGIYGQHHGIGGQTVNLVCTDSPAVPCKITTRGTVGYGILGWHAATNSGDIRVNIEGDYIITTESVDLISESSPYTAADGIYAIHQGTGDIHVDTQGTITTAGTHSYGIRGRHMGSGHVNLATAENNRILTTGPSGHGIVASHEGTATSGRSIDITVDGRIDVSGTGAQGVRISTLSGGAPVRIAARDDDGFLQQTVTVNGAITSAAEGVFLANGGKVIIGPRGSITSGMGIAILATGTVPEDNSDPLNVIPALPPRLRVDLDLDGRRIAEVLNGGWILNDGGGTTLAVNDVVLHEWDTGVVAGAKAANGVWNVTMRAAGVNVSDYSSGDPMTWTKTAPAEGVIADRDFSAEDFTEQRRACPSGYGTPPNCVAPPPPEPEPPVIMEKYAPRAALYEALPDFLLELRTTNLPGYVLRSVSVPAWITLSATTGERDLNRSVVGARYDTEHLVLTAAGTVLQGRHLDVQVAVHHVSAFADVTSPVQGGDIHAKGQGLSLEMHWDSAGNHYAKGRAAWTDCALDIDSSDESVGRLVSSLGARRLALQIEAGQRRPLGVRAHWSPHVRLSHTRVRIDRFTDTVQSRVSFENEERSRILLGVTSDAVRSAGGGKLSLRASAHWEHHFGGTATTINVSGERLGIEARNNDLILALGAGWQRGPWVLDADLSVRTALGYDSHEFAATLSLGIQL